MEPLPRSNDYIRYAGLLVVLHEAIAADEEGAEVIREVMSMVVTTGDETARLNRLSADLYKMEDMRRG